MARSETLPIYVDTYNLVKTVFGCTVKFSREHKFVLGAQLNEHVLDLCCLVMKAHHAQNRLPVLDDFLCLMEKVRLELRLSVDFYLMTYKQFADLALQTEKIEKQAIAWQKAEKRKSIK